ncbi:MAG TPA: SDR family oxidoreductase [Stellaceae bacterium]|jgi:nucleoside-diphosphate-sugar epimerase|nr:SDR family oxidoreductase [Stellaceae bacterium]
MNGPPAGSDRPTLLCFGFGYSARALARRLGPEWRVTGTSREGGQGTRRFDRNHPLPAEAFVDVSHILVSVPPDEAGDPVLGVHAAEIAAMPGLAWLGYLSTTGVYGDRGGAWVDETSELRPTGERGSRRAAAEAGWLDLHRCTGVAVHIFRLAGIYGAGRSPFDALRAGTAKRIAPDERRPGQVFSRIHVDDLAAILLASIARPRPGAIYNVCDDEPAAPADVVAHAAALLGINPPPLIPFAQAALSPTARSFYDDNKRVSNALMKRELGVGLRYPDYRAGLAAILAAGG